MAPVSFFHAADLRDSALVIRPRPPAMSRNFHEYARLVMRTFPLPVTPAILPRQKPPSLFPMTVRFLELRISHESACPVVSVVHTCACGSGPLVVSGSVSQTPDHESRAFSPPPPPSLTTLQSSRKSAVLAILNNR